MTARPGDRPVGGTVYAPAVAAPGILGTGSYLPDGSSPTRPWAGGPE
jgi:hypothetical protein